MNIKKRGGTKYFYVNECYAYLLSMKLSNLVFLKTYSTDMIRYDNIISLTDQNAILLEVEDKVNLTLLINKYK